MKRPWKAVRTTDGWEVRKKVNKTWYTIADVYMTLNDKKEFIEANINAKLIAKLLNENEGR